MQMTQNPEGLCLALLLWSCTNEPRLLILSLFADALCSSLQICFPITAIKDSSCNAPYSMRSGFVVCKWTCSDSINFFRSQNHKNISETILHWLQISTKKLDKWNLFYTIACDLSLCTESHGAASSLEGKQSHFSNILS